MVWAQSDAAAGAGQRAGLPWVSPGGGEGRRDRGTEVSHCLGKVQPTKKKKRKKKHPNLSTLLLPCGPSLHGGNLRVWRNVALPTSSPCHSQTRLFFQGKNINSIFLWAASHASQPVQGGCGRVWVQKASQGARRSAAQHLLHEAAGEQRVAAWCSLLLTWLRLLPSTQPFK